MHKAELIWARGPDGRLWVLVYDRHEVLVGEGQGDSLGEALRDAGLELD